MRAHGGRQQQPKQLRLLLPHEVRLDLIKNDNRSFVERLSVFHWEHGGEEDEEFGVLAELILEGWGRQRACYEAIQAREAFFLRFRDKVQDDYGPCPNWRLHLDTRPEAWFAYALFTWSKGKPVERATYTATLRAHVDSGAFLPLHAWEILQAKGYTTAVA